MTEPEAAADCADARDNYEKAPSPTTAHHWRRAALVWLGALDAPYTQAEVRRASEACEEWF